MLETIKQIVFHLGLLAGGGAVAAVVGLLSLGFVARWSWKGAGRAPRLLQPFSDVAKLLRKETVIPAGANRAVFVLMPLLALAAVSLAACILAGNVLWQNGLIGPHRLVGDVFLLFALLAVPPAALAMGASGSGNPFAAVTAERTVRLMASLLPMGLALVTVLVLAGRAQKRLSAEIGRQVTELTEADSDLRAAVNAAGVPVRLPVCMPDLLMSGRSFRAGRSRLVGMEARMRLHREIETYSLDVPDAEATAVYSGLDGAAMSRAMDLGGSAAGWARAAVLLCIVVFVLGAAALAGLPPFDCAEDASLGGGVLIEYGGPLLAAWITVRGMLVFCLLAFCGLLFMGGFSAQLPGLGVDWHGLAGPAAGEAWRALGLNLAHFALTVLKYLVPLTGLGLLARDLKQRTAAGALRFFTGPALLAGFAALAIAISLFWQAGGCP